MKNTFKVLPLIASLASLSALAQTPADITPPAGNKAAMTLVGVGTLAYECKAVADKPGTFAWTFAGPDAKLLDAGKKEVGKYYGGPSADATLASVSSWRPAWAGASRSTRRCGSSSCLRSTR